MDEMSNVRAARKPLRRVFCRRNSYLPARYKRKFFVLKRVYAMAIVETLVWSTPTCECGLSGVPHPRRWRRLFVCLVWYACCRM